MPSSHEGVGVTVELNSQNKGVRCGLVAGAKGWVEQEYLGRYRQQSVSSSAE